MFIDDITVRRIQKQDIGDLFNVAKASLTEKGIENIRDDLLMTGLKNACSKKTQQFDFGLYKLNKLIGFCFIELTKVFYEKDSKATYNTIYIIPEYRNKENYKKIFDTTFNFLREIDVVNVVTTDNFTLCNDCNILQDLFDEMVGITPKTYYRAER